MLFLYTCTVFYLFYLLHQCKQFLFEPFQRCNLMLVMVIQCNEPDLDQFIKLSNEVVIKPFLLKSSASFLNSSGTSLCLFFILIVTIIKSFYSQFKDLGIAKELTDTIDNWSYDKLDEINRITPII